jgi:hypothetical protein
VSGSEHRPDANGDGFVAIELVAAIGLLLLPIVVLVASLPGWVERHHAAAIAAREAARVLVNDWPNSTVADATDAARDVAADYGIDATDLTVDATSVDGARGTIVRVEVTVTMTGGWHDTAVSVRRIDDYRSR